MEEGAAEMQAVVIGLLGETQGLQGGAEDGALSEAARAARAEAGIMGEGLAVEDGLEVAVEVAGDDFKTALIQNSCLHLSVSAI